MKGKNFSCNQKKELRNKQDFYQTPKSLTWQLLEVEKFSGEILEPCAGKGAISNVLNDFGYRVTTRDINNGQDFLTFNDEFDNIITNPPFRLANEFILKAKELYKKKIAMLLPLSYVHGQKRYNLKIFENLSAVYVFTRYPLLTDTIRSDGKYNTGMMVYAWFIWEKNYLDKPKINWLDNNKYVLGKC